MKSATVLVIGCSTGDRARRPHSDARHGGYEVGRHRPRAAEAAVGVTAPLAAAGSNTMSGSCSKGASRERDGRCHLETERLDSCRVAERQPMHVSRFWPGRQGQVTVSGLAVAWRNAERLHSACGGVPPAEFEAAYHSLRAVAEAA